MKGLSIQTRVFVISLLPTLIISILLGIYIIGSRINDAETQFSVYGKALLSHVVRSSRVGILKNNLQALQDLTNVLVEEKDINSILFFGAQHELLAYSGPIDPQSQEILKRTSFSTDGTSVIEGKEYVTFTAPVIDDDLHLTNKTSGLNLKNHHSISHQKIIGWVSLTFSRANTVLQEYQVIMFTIIFLTLGLLFSVFLARRTARHLTHPLLRMRAAVKKIEQGQLETQLATDSPGELGELEKGINNMTLSLQGAHDELQDNIEKATSNLKLSLETIEKQNTELAEAQKEALEASRVKSEFIANMSHEIRTPMNGIIGFTNLVLETELSNLQRNYLTTIQKSTLSLLNLVNNILDFSRLDAGQLRLDYLAFDVRDCIEDVLTLMSPLANAKQLEFSALIDEDVPRKIISDPLRFKQIVINLASNAIKFTEQGEVAIHVTLEKKTPKSAKLRITVSDTGIGLSPGDQKLIFRAFQQADASIARKYGGTGLGLAICKKLIDQMAGKIGIESNESKGSQFWFTFSAERTQTENEPESDLVHLTDCGVYLHETHEITRTALKNALLHWQMDTTDFTDFADMIDQLKNSKARPEIIITGINQQIHQTTAIHYLSQIRELFQGPIIVLTNSSEQAALEFFLSIGASLCLTKPVIRHNLYHAIYQLLHDKTDHTLKTIAHAEQDLNLQLDQKDILCVDDNIHNANLVSALFANTHAKVTLAQDGNEAVQLCEKTRFDLILMDLRMPKMDGIEALKFIRQPNHLNTHTPIIALSAHISEHEYKNLTEIGFNDYLTKPVMKNTLLKTVKKFIHSGEPLKLTSKLELPVIDWEQGLKLAGNKRELAEEMLALMAKSLPEELHAIQQSYIEKEFNVLLQRLHKLHGAVCYCGTPRLKNTIAALEMALKNNELEDVHSLLLHFEAECNALLQELEVQVS